MINGLTIGAYGNALTTAVCNFKTVASTPSQYRLTKKPDGMLVLQGAYQFHSAASDGFEWCDIPTVEVTE